MKHFKLWSKEEKEFIIENYGKMTSKEIGIVLNKSETTVRQQAHVLKINKPAFDLNPGDRFGRLIVISKSNKRNSGGGVKYLCKCDCGKEKLISKDQLVNLEGTRSCGCLISESTRKRFTQEAGNATFNHLYRLCKRGAAKRDKIFELTKEDH